ncbi:DUF3265 domain-containing protein [Vibrio parahaemolyticus]|nr:hypothetical protein CA156_23690 [Vibrio parahaemolyticus]HAS6579696.1 DUF3265 domain-containing protein [Vibrio parahaemolyticus]HAS6584457.1 DUF3265 domain-containing protein [Vibrio parahaemolyticus]
MTRRSSGIHAAWHFWYALSFGGESGVRKVGLCGIHPLTRRYGFLKNDTVWINSICCLCSIRCVKYCFYFNLSGHNECVNPYVVKC